MEDESAPRWQIMLPLVRKWQRGSGNLHAGIGSFCNNQPMAKTIEQGKVENHRQRCVGPVDASDDPSVPGTPREDSDPPGLSHQAPGFIPACGCVLQDSHGLRWQRVKELGLVHITQSASTRARIQVRRRMPQSPSSSVAHGLSTNSLSICSSVLPFVSGSLNLMNMNPATQIAA